jgi:transcription elongation factor GreB
MSKAFTKEQESEEEGAEQETPLPPGGRNYITRAGFEALQAELRSLIRVERPRVVETVSWAAGNGDRSENGDYIYGKKRLGEIDRRIRFLTKRLAIADVVDPTQQKNRDRVFFGATVTYEDGRRRARTITIVGIDEADADQGRVSWISPIARALLKARAGDAVELHTPTGTETVAVIAISYDA